LVTLLPVVAWPAPQAFAQDVDAMAKWTALTVVHYRVVGEFSGESRLFSFEKTYPVSDSAPVTDRAEFEFDWNQNEMSLVGKPVIRNFPTKTGALAPLPGCPGTKVEGPFEFATIVALKVVPYQGLGLAIRRDHPGGATPQPAKESGGAPCGHAWDQVAPKADTSDKGLQVPPGMMLAMPPKLSPFPLTKDGKSLIVKDQGWTWTFTPTPVK
jgi:hypothetical protein